jgi:hypothetical protein
MPRFIDPAPIQFYQGDPIPGGLLYFYESGTNTDKATYKESSLTEQNTQPVVLDAAGRVPNIFYQGTAKVILRTSSGTLVWEKDPVGGENLVGNWSSWSANIVYDNTNIVVGSDGKYYQSKVNDNIGNDPVLDTENDFWFEVTLPTSEQTNEVTLHFYRNR